MRTARNPCQRPCANGLNSKIPKRHLVAVWVQGSSFRKTAKSWTNHHVVDGAQSVKVTLADGRVFDAEVIGSDAATDIALISIKAEVALPFVNFGSSDTMRVGDEVVAVGNPFGLSSTVTSGIISAKSRDINAGPYDEFIQTDAANQPW